MNKKEYPRGGVSVLIRQEDYERVIVLASKNTRTISGQLHLVLEAGIKGLEGNRG